ncbi:cysteine methyltransferase [Fervidobacterium thailandense]|uniref:Methylated-DNA--protein-cysteine methyltransferase n=1 Tax=Fervidobacterium thailandense TaxID=1008305 RepID=A0A1E3G1Q3_9BACT|nr:cysteine methyltransferase [Fervidobacterium thailandense]
MSIVSCEIGSIIVHTVDNRCVRILLSTERLEDQDDNIFTEQIRGYLRGEIRLLDFPVSYNLGPVFRKVLEYLREKVQYGTIISYGELAKQLKLNPRVVGFALANNPLPLYFPCHRVVGKNSIGGFTVGKGESGLIWKEFLLKLEGAIR